MVFGVSGFQSQAIAYSDDNVACEHIHKKQLKALSFFNQHIHPSLFLLGMLIFGAKELSLRQTARTRCNSRQLTNFSTLVAVTGRRINDTVLLVWHIVVILCNFATKLRIYTHQRLSKFMKN